MVTLSNFIRITGSGREVVMHPKDAIGTRAAQIVLSRRERDVTVRLAHGASSTSIRPSDRDGVECVHEDLDSEGEGEAGALAESAVVSGVLELEIDPDFWEAWQKLNV